MVLSIVFAVMYRFFLVFLYVAFSISFLNVTTIKQLPHMLFYICLGNRNWNESVYIYNRVVIYDVILQNYRYRIMYKYLVLRNVWSLHVPSLFYAIVTLFISDVEPNPSKLLKYFTIKPFCERKLVSTSPTIKL